MPELPDITVYIEALERRIVGQQLEGVRINSPFVLRTFEPPLEAIAGKKVLELRRLGKRIAIGLEDDLWLVVHLMIAGRLHWKPRGARLTGKFNLVAFDFSNGTLILTEAGSKRRAALSLVKGTAALAEHDPGGLDVFSVRPKEFEAALRRENHTLKRSLTDPHLISGIGNAYSDEILHRARLSPLLLTQKTDFGRGKATARRDAERSRGMDRSAARAGGRWFSRQSDRLSSGDGRSRPLRQTLPGVRSARAAHSLRGQRD